MLDYFQRNRHFIGYVVGFVGVFIGLWAVATLALRVSEDQKTISRQTRLIEQQQQQIAHQAELGLRTYRATCTFRADLIRRVRESNEFLATHPNGFAGIPAKTLEASIVNEESTIKSLEQLACPGQA